EPGALEALTDACEDDALAFFGELEKLCSWVGAGRLGKEEVLSLLRPAVGAELPDFLAAVAAGHSPMAAQGLVRLLAAGVGEGSVLFALSNLVGGALGGWSRHREASETLRRRLPPRSLARALDALYRAESAWKGGEAGRTAGCSTPPRRWASPSPTASTCSPIHPARASMSGTPRATPRPTSCRATSGCAGSTCSTPWDGTPSACRPSSTPYAPACT